MPSSAHISSLRESIPGCRALAFVDLSARLVLRADSDPPMGQETLDALCTRAALALTAPVGPAAQAALESPASPREAAMMHPERMEVYVRAQGDIEDALCAILLPGTAIVQALDTLRAGIDDLVAAEDATAATDPEAMT